jgi:outer membrane protein OmpA-like peptidoglycan-associated protein
MVTGSVVCAAGPPAARAQGLDAERWVPAAGAAGGFTVERPIVPFHLGVGLGLFVHFADDPLIERDTDSGDIASRPIDDALSAELMASLGLFDFAELAVHAPVRLVYSGDADAPFEGGAGIGDVRVVPRVTVWRGGSAARHAALGLMLPVSIPTGDETELRGAGGVTVEPRAMVLLQGESLGLIANVGYRWRAEHPDGLPWGDELAFGLAVTYALAPDALDLHAELTGGKHVSTDVDAADLEDLPLAALLGVVYRPDDAWSLYAGAGAGVTEGLGEPDFRLVAGVRFSSSHPRRDGFGDGDGDGLADKDDDCPDEPEDMDGFADHDGCPEADNDRDGIADGDDECPDLPEERGGDGDGCPERTYVQIKDGTMVIFGKVQFKTGSAEIEAKSEPLIDQIAASLVGYPDIGLVRIEGHTDDVGGDDINQRLSEQRAASVRAALIRRGVAEGRLETTGVGESRPIAPNATAAGRAKNRRVEFIIVK